VIRILTDAFRRTSSTPRPERLPIELRRQRMDVVMDKLRPAIQEDAALSFPAAWARQDLSLPMAFRAIFRPARVR